MTSNKWMFITGAIAVSGIYYFTFLKPKSSKKDEQMTNFEGSEFGKKVRFELSNVSDESQTFPFFKTDSNIQNQEVEINPSISDFNRNLAKNPINVKAVEIIPVNASMIGMINEDLSKVVNGINEPVAPSYTNKKVGKEIHRYNMNDLLIDGNSHIEYTLKPKTTIHIVFHY